MSMAPSELSGHLDAGERTLWHGSPPSGLLVFRKLDLFFVPFSFLWFAFALFWEVGVLSVPGGPPILFPIMGGFFVCVGFYMAVGRFFWDAYVRNNTLYALTNQRAIILVRSPSHHLRSVQLSPATEVSTEECADGSGSITFGAKFSPYPGRGWQAGVAGDFVFEFVPGVRNVMKTVRQIQSVKT